MTKIIVNGKTQTIEDGLELKNLIALWCVKPDWKIIINDVEIPHDSKIILSDCRCVVKSPEFIEKVTTEIEASESSEKKYAPVEEEMPKCRRCETKDAADGEEYCVNCGVEEGEIDPSDVCPECNEQVAESNGWCKKCAMVYKETSTFDEDEDEDEDFDEDFDEDDEDSCPMCGCEGNEENYDGLCDDCAKCTECESGKLTGNKHLCNDCYQKACDKEDEKAKEEAENRLRFRVAIFKNGEAAMVHQTPLRYKGIGEITSNHRMLIDIDLDTGEPNVIWKSSS